MSHLLRRFDLPTLSLLPAGEPFGGGLRESLAEIEGWTPAGVGREISDEAFLVTLATGLNAAADGERGSDGGTISMSAATSSSTSVDRYSVRKSAPSARIGSVCVNRNVLCARSRRTTRSRNPSARLRTSKPCLRNSVLMAHPLQWAAIIVSAFTILCHLSMAFFLMYSAIRLLLRSRFFDGFALGPPTDSIFGCTGSASCARTSRLAGKVLWAEPCLGVPFGTPAPGCQGGYTLIPCSRYPQPPVIARRFAWRTSDH